MAIGQTMIIITGGIDLVGSVLAASAMITARLVIPGVVSPWLPWSSAWVSARYWKHQRPDYYARKGDAVHCHVGMLSIAAVLPTLLASGLQGTASKQRAHARQSRSIFLGVAILDPYPSPSSRCSCW